MRIRPLVAVAVLVPFELLERSAYYGPKSILKVWMVRELFIDPVRATEAIHLLAQVTYGLPFLGALIAVAIGPRVTLGIGALVASLGLALLAGSDSLDSVRPSLLVLALGGGLMKPCIVAALADAVPDPAETARNLAFVGFYVAINVGSFLATLVAPMAMSAGHARWVFAAAALLTFAASLFALGLAFFWRFSREPEPTEQPGEWWRPTLGALVLALLAIPYYLVIDTGSSAAFRTAVPVRDAAQMAALNPVYVTVTGALLLLMLGGALAAQWRIRGLLLVGVGFALTAAGGIPVLIAPGSWWAVLATMTVMAVGETFVGGALLSRIASGHHWRVKAVFVAAALTGVSFANLPSGLISTLPVDRQSFAHTILLATAIAVSGLAGAVIAVAHAPLSRFFWPEVGGRMDPQDERRESAEPVSG